MVHSVSAVALIMTIMVHIYAALWVKGTITAMVEGWYRPRGRRNITHAGIASSANAKHNRKNVPDEYSHHPQEQLEKSEKNTAEQVPPLLFPG